MEGGRERESDWGGHELGMLRPWFGGSSVPVMEDSRLWMAANSLSQCQIPPIMLSL